MSLFPERTYAVTGPSGSGKSTLLSIMAGWEPPAEGTIVATGITRATWVFQSPHGMALRTALDHVSHPLIAAGQDIESAQNEASEILTNFRLDHLSEQPFSSLSGGEAQRLMLARAVAAHPQLLLVDEPTAQLDLMTARHVNQVLSGLAAAGRIVVIATHDLGTRDSCTDRINLVDYLPSTRMGL